MSKKFGRHNKRRAWECRAGKYFCPSQRRIFRINTRRAADKIIPLWLKLAISCAGVSKRQDLRNKTLHSRTRRAMTCVYLRAEIEDDNLFVHG